MVSMNFRIILISLRVGPGNAEFNFFSPCQYFAVLRWILTASVFVVFTSPRKSIKYIYFGPFFMSLYPYNPGPT